MGPAPLPPATSLPISLESPPPRPESPEGPSALPARKRQGSGHSGSQSHLHRLTTSRRKPSMSAHCFLHSMSVPEPTLSSWLLSLITTQVPRLLLHHLARFSLSRQPSPTSPSPVAPFLRSTVAFPDNLVWTRPSFHRPISFATLGVFVQRRVCSDRSLFIPLAQTSPIAVCRHRFLSSSPHLW